MFNSSKLFATFLVPVALVGATAGFVAGCGDGGVDKSALNDLKKKGDEIQAQSKDAQAKIKQISADIKSGKISAADGQKKIEAITTSLEKNAKSAASDGIDAIKNNSHLSADQKKQLEDAQASLK